MKDMTATADFDDDATPADQLAEIVIPFRTPTGALYAEVMLDGHREIWPISGKMFPEMIQRIQRKETGRIFAKKELAKFIDALEAEAQFGDAVHDVHVRVARVADRIYVDLCDPSWRVIEIDSTGWRILGHAPVRFRRTSGMLALPEPVSGGDLNALWDFVRIEDIGERQLVIAHLLGTLASVQPYPVLYLLGGQGTAKSTSTKILRHLVDPHVAAVRSPPKSERDLFVAAQHGHLLTFDNISQINNAMSDALCRMATGGTFATRKNFSDSDEVLLAACNPVLCNGIVPAFTRPDLVDRTITVQLGKIPEGDRQLHEEIFRDFEAVRPALLGALFDALSIGLRRKNVIPRPALPRMADFAFWGIACEPGYAVEGAFFAAYRESILRTLDESLAEDPVAPRIRELLVHRNVWEGTATRLEEGLRGLHDLPVQQDWPKTAKLMSDHLRRIAPALQNVGVSLTFERRGHDRERVIKLRRDAM